MIVYCVVCGRGIERKRPCRKNFCSAEHRNLWMSENVDFAKLAKRHHAAHLTELNLKRNPYCHIADRGNVNSRKARRAAAEYMPYRKSDHITKICNAKFDPDCETPLWSKLLKTISQGDAEYEHFIQKALGYALTGDTSEQVLFIPYGTGCNGKSTFLNVFSAVMNNYAQSASSDAFQLKKNENVNNDIARLKGARYVTAIEMEENKRLNEALLKSMTGGDKLVTRFLYGEFFEYVPQFKVFLAVNHLPIIRDMTESTWRRIRVIMPFEKMFEASERDNHFAEKIMANELDGILAWAVQGCLMWQKEKLGFSRIVMKATSFYRMEMDSFSSFFEECCEERENGHVTNKMLRTVYDEWCRDNGEYALTQRPFSAKLLEKGFKKKRAPNGAYEWSGFALRGQASRL